MLATGRANTNLVKVDVVVERKDTGEPGGAKPSNSIPAHGKENESHIKL